MYVCSSFRAGFLSLNKNLCAQDQATCMTKMLVCGMPLDEVIKASTSTPAAAIGYGDKIGTLRVGAEADIALLEMRRTDFMLEDSQAQTRRCTQRLIARGVWRAGVAGKITSPEQVGAFPNLRNVALHRPSWNILVVRDIVAPPEVSPEYRAMVEQRLAEMEEKAEEWMKSSPVGDGNPNTPLWLTVSAAHSNPTRCFPAAFRGSPWRCWKRAAAIAEKRFTSRLACRQLPWCEDGDDTDWSVGEVSSAAAGAPTLPTLAIADRATPRLLISYPEQ